MYVGSSDSVIESSDSVIGSNDPVIGSSDFVIRSSYLVKNVGMSDSVIYICREQWFSSTYMLEAVV